MKELCVVMAPFVDRIIIKWSQRKYQAEIWFNNFLLNQ